MSALSDCEQQLRRLINARRRHWQLMADPHRFNQLCSALDVIGDTDMALDAYLAKEHQPVPEGQRYLDTYGVLQVMFTQQDAVEHVAHALELEYVPNEHLMEIREIRNDSVGHPTRRGKPPGRAFNFIVRVSMSWKGFELGTATPEWDFTFRYVDVPGLISTQRELLASALRSVIESVVQDEARHRRTFRTQPLLAAFPQTLGYAMEKLAEEIRGDRRLGAGPVYVEMFRRAVNDFEQKLNERQELPTLRDVFEHHAGPLRHALTRLNEFFTGTPGLLTADDAEAFRVNAMLHVENLETLAREIDEEYASDPDLAVA